MSNKLSHINSSGYPAMVDVSSKPETHRVAVAKGEIRMQAETLKMIIKGDIEKGNVITVAQLAGIQAAKRTAELIPLCHPLPIDMIDVSIDLEEDLPGATITTLVHSTGKTGVEMEALTAVTVAALTVYDMAKGLDKTMIIQNIRLVEKHGGTSGDIIND